MNKVKSVKTAINNGYLEKELELLLENFKDYELRYNLNYKGNVVEILLDVITEKSVGETISLVNILRYLGRIHRAFTGYDMTLADIPFRIIIYSGKTDKEVENNKKFFESDDYTDYYYDYESNYYDEDTIDIIHYGQTTINLGNIEYTVGIDEDRDNYCISIINDDYKSPETGNSIVTIKEYKKFGEENEVSIEVYKDETKYLNKIELIEFSKTINEINKEFSLNLENYKPESEDNDYLSLLNDLKFLSSEEIISKTFKPMDKEAINVERDTVFYVDSKENIGVRYYSTGVDFCWNSIDYEVIKGKVDIDVESCMLDMSDSDFFDRDFRKELSFHNNIIVYNSVNNYQTVLNRKLIDVTKPEYSDDRETKAFSLYLNRGKAERVIVNQNKLLLLNKDDKYVFITRDNDIYDVNKLINLVNEIIEKSN